MQGNKELLVLQDRLARLGDLEEPEQQVLPAQPDRLDQLDSQEH